MKTRDTKTKNTDSISSVVKVNTLATLIRVRAYVDPAPLSTWRAKYVYTGLQYDAPQIGLARCVVVLSASITATLSAVIAGWIAIRITTRDAFHISVMLFPLWP